MIEVGPESIGRRRIITVGDRRLLLVELPRVRIVTWMLEFAVSAQVVAPCVRRPAQGALESTRKMHVIMVPDMGHYFAAQFTPVQVAAAWQFVECQTHMPGF